jgi:sugar transferase (PEP-CTERM system associated)
MTVRIFRHYIPTPLLVLGTAEWLVLTLSVYAAVFILLLQGWAGRDLSIDPLLPKALVFPIVLFVTMNAAGLYQFGLRDGPQGIAVRLVMSFVIGAAMMGLLFYTFPGLFIGNNAFAASLGLAFVGVALVRAVFYLLADSEVFRRRLLVLGAGSQAALIEQRLRRRTDRRGLNLVGYVHTRSEPDAVSPAKILRVRSTLLDLARENAVQEIVIAIDDRKANFPIDDLIECKMSGIHVIDLLTFLERQIGKIQLDILQPVNMVFLDGFSHAVLKKWEKRAFDVAMSLAMLSVAAPVMAITALAILAESGGRGPVLYRQDRVGRNGRVFSVVKFRSMRVDAEKHGVAQWACEDDPRVTRVGRFIRKVRIDELPQLWNVLRGDMSFVGPRPERPQFVAELSRRIPYYTLRHRVNPGITGWAQVRYPYGSSEKDAKEKLEYDLYYIKNYSVFLDLSILFQTVQVILTGQGAR